jgi:hypothetical protein
MFVYREWERFCSKIYNLNVKCVTAYEALELSKFPDQYVIIKHDVETNVEKALKLASIENKYNIRSTYYVQSYLIESIKNIKLLKEIHKLGHEVTYHYDTLDSNNGDFKLAELEFDKTLLKFKNLGMEVKTVCPHGNPIKERSGWSSNKDFFRNEALNSKYSEIADIVINPEKFINKEMIYVSDAGFGWKRITDISNNDKNKSEDKELKGLNDVINLIQDKNKSLIISAHPHRWGKYKISAFFHRNVFFTLRSTARILTKIPFLNKFISKFYYLAKKI